METHLEMPPSEAAEQYLRQVAVELAIKLTLKDEALFAGGMLDYADRIHKFIKSGEVITKPIKE